jgi:septal ring-binding cell division protein DamX
MYGDYSSKQKALDAHKKLPKSLALSKPWVREIKAVKQQVSAQKTNKNTSKQKSKPKLKVITSTTPLTTPLTTTVKLISISSKSIPINGLNDNKWTFQLISLSSEASMIDYIKRNKLASQAYYFERVVNGKKRYTLIYGSYASKQQAEKQLKTLPATIRQGKPWIRSYADIKKLMTG